ncbi:MAG: metallophosphoesterase [Sulfolobales archaeon]
MRQAFTFIFIIILGLIDLYFYQGLSILIAPLSHKVKIIIDRLYVAFVGLTFMTFLAYVWLPGGTRNPLIKYRLLPAWVIKYLAKLLSSLLLLLDDVGRVVKWVGYKVLQLFRQGGLEHVDMPRSVWWTQIGMAAAAIPLATLGYGIILGAHDYRVRRVRIKLPHLPAAFHGLIIGQLSDIHSGSFFNKKAVAGGVSMLLQEKPDIIFFTGDLVNDTADEVKDYIHIFQKVKAKLGVFSTLGNHDYGDYISWPSLATKQQNLQDLCQAHRELGWRLLNNEHVLLGKGADQLAIIGVENWGTRFSKHGNLALATQGTDGIPVKLLLSHDPSHWDAEVRPQFGDIDVTFSGHTHGFQFGIEIGSLKWSPVQYRYKQWAGLYQEGNQYLYVNRGFGYLGYPGRIGIWPEITIVELVKA